MHMERAWRPNNFPAWVLEFRSATCCCRLNTNLVMLLVADNTRQFSSACTSLIPACTRHETYLARIRRCGRLVGLGSFATAEEAALCVPRLPEGQAAAQRATVVPLKNERGGRGSTPAGAPGGALTGLTLLVPTTRLSLAAAAHGQPKWPTNTTL